MMIEKVVPLVCTIIKLALSIKNGNHQAINSTKQFFATNNHGTILSLMTHFDFDSVSSHMKFDLLENLFNLTS